MTDADAIPCDRCGTPVPYGQSAGDQWLCQHCVFREDDSIDVVIGDSATCDCGAETQFRYSPSAPAARVVARRPSLFGFDDDDSDAPDVIAVEIENAGLWICPRCLEVFGREPQ